MISNQQHDNGFLVHVKSSKMRTFSVWSQLYVVNGSSQEQDESTGSS